MKVILFRYNNIYYSIYILYSPDNAAEDNTPADIMVEVNEGDTIHM